MRQTDLEAVSRLLASADRLLLTTHIRPDGDAVGSLLGMGLALEALGKEVHMVMEDNVPQAFRHLEGSERIEKQPDGNYDVIIVLDCGDASRPGAVLEGLPAVDVNIDHHPTNTGFGRYNLLNPQAVATCEILSDIFPLLGLAITPAVAAALLTGILTDTIGFRTSNVTPKALRTAAALMEAGADLPTLYEKALNARTYEAVRLWGAGLSTLQRQDRLVWATLTLEDRRAIGYPGLDDADLINLLTLIQDADIAVTFTEQPEGKVKVSWRARPGYDVSTLAYHFGGGGHQPAAGATISGNLSTVQQQVLTATRALLNGTKTTKNTK